MDHLRPRVGDQPGQNGENFSAKNTKISEGWWHTSMIPATQEGEAHEYLLEPRRQRLEVVMS